MKGLRVINVAICYSPNWAEHVAIEVFALFRSNPPPIKVYLVSDGSCNLKIDCPKGCIIEYIDLERLFKERIPSAVNVDNRFTRFALYRLLLPEIIPDDRVIYIDADAIVNGDITELFNLNMDGCLVAGVTDSGAGADKYNLKAAIGLAEDEPYINAGVTLLDLAEIRKLNLLDKWLYEINNHWYGTHDQDILNLSCRGRIKLIGLKYNVSLSTGLDENDIRIMHFAGAKPWNTANVPHYEIWQRWSREYGGNSMDGQTRIPKKIHTCWFGHRPKPPIIERCLATWRKILPDYEIVEWNEHNFDVNCCAYVREAYRSGKYAFVTDYVRLWALFNYGGIYMDADVEVLKPFDRFLHHRAFTGHETDDLMVTAVMGAEPGHPWIKVLLDHYAFANFDPVPNTQVITQLCQPFIEKRLYGFKYLQNGVVIYPIDTFCGYNHQELKPIITENSYAVHHFAGTWLGRVAI